VSCLESRTEPTSGLTRFPLPFNGFGQCLFSFWLPLRLVSFTCRTWDCGAHVVESPWWLVRSGKLKEAEHALRRLSRKGDTADPAKTVAMMVRTNQHELENQPGVSFFDCFKGSDLRRTEIAVVGWAVQVLSGSSFGNQGTYFFQQGKRSPSMYVRSSLTSAAGLNTADSFKFNLGMYALGFCGTCGSWVTMTVRLQSLLARNVS
jgi:hypothetical protein